MLLLTGLSMAVRILLNYADSGNYLLLKLENKVKIVFNFSSKGFKLSWLTRVNDLL